MRRTIVTFLAVLSLGTSLSSCKVYFAHNMREELAEQEVPVKAIQYYLSRKVKLRRLAGSSTITQDTASLVQRTNIEIDLVKLKRNTPGVVVAEFTDELEVAFENCDGCSLKFVRQERDDSEIYQIGAAEWVNNVGRIEYEGKTYYIAPRRTLWGIRPNDAALKVKSKYLYKFKYNRRKAKGRKVSKKN